ncbi:DsbA family oxidoreductase [Effusibacillus lacus]|uniref:DSBA-like thioredoxin domain-containing protein n=1 Tax=Effusibacillus lacus TaxID=1348429 RepID=A0A292YQF6_9BACL|nr:DsbA family protein [Effusibacillus lacus]TCS71076.1 putative DsbA family dithiol-disulfide isomerase [Effusibacillus lacus]GAX90720.1 hypothetical protein EFBL_2361 [Effusibacillus lacus]
MAKLDYYFDYACPWCYLGTKTVRELAAEGVEVTYHVWKMPSNVTPPPKPEGYYEAGKARLKELKEEMGMPLVTPIQKETVPALIATKVADKLGAAASYVEAVFHAHWGEQKDISNQETLVQLAKQIGLDEATFRSELAKAEAVQAYNKDLEQAAQLEISTIPSYRNGGKQLLIHHFNDMPTLDTLRELARKTE